MNLSSSCAIPVPLTVASFNLTYLPTYMDCYLLSPGWDHNYLPISYNYFQICQNGGIKDGCGLTTRNSCIALGCLFFLFTLGGL